MKFFKNNKIIIFFISLLLYVGWCIGNPTELVDYKTNSFSLSASTAETTRRLSLKEGEPITQKITVGGNGNLSQFKVRLVDVPDTLDGYIEVKVIDDSNQVLHDEVIDGDFILNGDFYVTSSFIDLKADELDIEVAKDKTLFLELSVHDMSKTPSVIICKRNNVDTLKIGNSDISNEFLVLDYNVKTTTYYYWIIVLVSLLIILAVFTEYRNNKLKKYYRYALYILTPLIIQLCGEWMNGTIGSIKLKYFLTNLFLCYLLYILLQCIFNKKIGSIVFVVVSSLLLVLNYHLLQFRGQPLMVTDISQLGTALTVANNYSFSITLPIATIFTLSVLIIVSNISSNSAISTVHNNYVRKTYIPRIVSSLVIVIIIVQMCLTTEMNLSNWNITDSFNSLGWLYTNLKLTKSYLNIAPDGYDKDNALNFIDDESLNTQITEDNIVPTNLIVIMDESFSDLSVLGSFQTNEEVLPYLDSLEENEYFEKGYIGVHVIGGGTSTSEWEFLTGSNSTFMDIGSLTPYNLLKNNSGKYSYLNLCSVLKDNDYSAIAMHPYGGTNYDRDKVYELFGFDDFKNIDNWYDDASWIRWCVSDEYDFDKIIEQYENKSSDKLFVFNVTMQNHGSYTYPMDSYNIQESTLANYELNSYLSLINYTDSALEKLIDYFSNVDEPTMIVFFGDHQPSLPNDFYDMVFETDSPSKEQQESKYVTPYFIWSNYARKTYNKSYINLNYLEAIVKMEAGLELDNWDKYLLSIMDKYPVIGKYGIFDSEYNFYSYSELNVEQEELLKQMKYAQYYRWTSLD